jgi:hypothetical protein
MDVHIWRENPKEFYNKEHFNKGVRNKHASYIRVFPNVSI